MKRRLALVGLVISLLLVASLPAAAGHDHYMLTPSGKCHQVAQGQTAISDIDHGGFHRYHFNVHLGRAGDGTLNDTDVKIAKNVCPT